MKEYIINNKVLLSIISIMFLLLLSLGGLVVYLYKDKETEASQQTLGLVDETAEEEVEVSDEFYIEVKGSVKKPGVYLVNSKTIINEAITLAGGFKSTAYTDNINLSKKVEKEMVIFVYTKSAYKKLKAASTTDNTTSDNNCTSSTYDISNCTDAGESIVKQGETDTIIDNTQETESKLININTASATELTNLSGVGESKAQSIIEYRNTNGLFKSIEEIKNVSGIGDVLYEQIKAYITI